MNVDLESGVPEKYVENTITCITCGRQFAFSQTVEGRCLRDHIAYMENDRRQLLASVAAGRGGGSNPSNIVVQGPTINMSNQQSTSVSAVAQASAAPPLFMYAQPRIGFFRRWRKRLLLLLCVLLLAGAAYGFAMLVIRGKLGNAVAPPTNSVVTPTTVLMSSSSSSSWISGSSLAQSTMPPTTTLWTHVRATTIKTHFE